MTWMPGTRAQLSALVLLAVIPGCSAGEVALTASSAAHPSTNRPERRSSGRYRLLGEPVSAPSGLYFKLNRKLPRERGGDTEVMNVQASVQLGGDDLGYNDESITYYRGRYCYHATLVERTPDADRPAERPGDQTRLRLSVGRERRALVVYLTRPEFDGYPERASEQVDALCGSPR